MLLICFPDTVHPVDRSFFDRDIYGMTPIDEVTSPSICTRFGTDAEAAAGVIHDIVLAVLSDPARYD